MSFTGYQIRGDVLTTMRRAAGNFMPDYGSWRYKLEKPKAKDEDPVEEEEEAREGALTTDTYAETGGTAGTDAVYGTRQTKEWVEDPLPSYEEAWEKFGESMKAAYGNDIQNYIDDLETQKKLYQDEDYEALGEHLNVSADEAKATWDAHGGGGHWEYGEEQYLITPATQGTPAYARSGAMVIDEAGNIVEEEHSTSGGSIMTKVVATEGPIGPQDPYANIDKFLAKQVNLVDVSGSIATKELHDHVKNIAGDIKNNVFFRPHNNDKERKTNQQEARNILNNISKSFKEDLSPGGTVDTFYKMYKENLVSDSITKQEKFIFGNLLQMKRTKPMIDENNHMVYPIQMPTGETFPATNQWINETIVKRTKPYGIAQDFQGSLSMHYEGGRGGAEWNKDSIIMTNKRMIDSNPNQLAALLLDDSLFHPRPLIDLILESKAPDYASQINKQEFVLNALGDKESREELENDLVNGLERIAFQSYSRGKAKHDEENKQDNPTAGMSIEEKVKYYTS